jgi:dienelactone hydrolase
LKKKLLDGRSNRALCAVMALLVSAGVTGALAQAAPPPGEVKGTAWQHSADSLARTLQQADLVLPAAATGAGIFSGKYKDAPAAARSRVPVVLFLHGSSGLGLKAIGEWQQWLAAQGVASLAPDSFALADHVTYKSPIDVASYERIHALRASEIAPALAALKAAAWADPQRLVLAGTSEGAVPVARHAGADFAAKLMFAWSCEANYFVQAPRNAFVPEQAVLNVISSTDPFFSRSNGWLGSDTAQGHCGAALKGLPKAAVVLVPDAPHTLLNFPAARHAVLGFLTAYGLR